MLTAVKDAGPNACPPMVIGVGIGGTFEKCALMAKKALINIIGWQTVSPYPPITVGWQLPITTLPSTAFYSKRMQEALDKGEPLPLDVKNNVIYYMGPSPARDGTADRLCSQIFIRNDL